MSPQNVFIRSPSESYSLEERTELPFGLKCQPCPFGLVLKLFNSLDAVILARCGVELSLLNLEVVSKVKLNFGSIICLQDVLDGALGWIVGRVVRADDCASFSSRTHSTKAIPGVKQWKKY